MLPLPPVVTTSLCVASVVAVTLASVFTRWIVALVLSTVRPSVSRMLIPPFVALALRVVTVVSIGLSVPMPSFPTPVPAHTRRPFDAISTLLPPSLSRMEPVVAVMLTFAPVEIRPPTLTSFPASIRISPPVLVVLLVVLRSMLPVPASMLIVPSAPEPPVWMSAPAVKVTSCAPRSVMLPVPLWTSAFDVILVPPPIACTRMLPVPFALIAVLSANAVPSFSMMSPAVVRTTMLPLPPVVTTSLCVASVATVTLASVFTRWIVALVSSTIRPSLSRMLMPPLVARALNVVTFVSSGFTLAPSTPTPVPAHNRRPFDAMSTLVSSLSLSRIEPAVAVMLTFAPVEIKPPTFTSFAASIRISPPVLVVLLVVLRSMLPVPASMLIVPSAPEPPVWMSAPAVKVTSCAPRSVMLPVPLWTSAFDVILVPPPIACTRMLPVPFALIAVLL